MRIIIQRVKEAKVEVRKKVVASIGKGLLLLVGFSPSDEGLPGTPLWNKILKKIVNLRIFPDDEKKMNLSLLDIKGEILVVSQFTLYADIKKGNRPSFVQAAPPDIAVNLYERFIKDLKESYSINVKSGIFGEEMFVHLCNWGPVTIVLDSEIL